MSAQAAIYALLSQSTGLSALVSTRIFPDLMPDTPTLPAVTYQKTSGSSARGAVADPPLLRAGFQVTTWANSRLAATAAADQVRTALDRQRKVTAGGVAVDDCFYEGDIDLFDNDTRTFYCVLDFTMFYRSA